MLQLYSTFTKHKSKLTEKSQNYQNGADAIMTLYELMLIQLKKDDEIIIDQEKLNIRQIANALTDNKVDNSVILRIFLDSMYDFIYTNIDVITEEKLDSYFNKINNELTKIFKVIDINRDKKDDEKSICMINYFYWDCKDIIEWIESIVTHSSQPKNDFISNNADKLILLAQKANDAQNEIRNKIFEESKTAAD